PDKARIGADRFQRARHHPFGLAPPRHRIFAFRRVPFGMVLVPIAHHLIHAPSVHTARKAAHIIDEVRGLSGSVYGRRMYEVMRYWDEDHAEWDAAEREYAVAWRSKPKWVVSRTLKSVGPNASLVG